MSEIINIHDAKTQFSKYVQRAHDGEIFIVAKAGVPMARLVPLEEKEKREPGIAKGRITEAFFEPLPEEILEAWNP